ncbi:hypothetical protein HDU88_002661 [Geranomyces variabilis]|nr:hypothetical protein HDU88_002661 [Geranomyces variabilis]
MTEDTTAAADSSSALFFNIDSILQAGNDSLEDLHNVYRTAASAVTGSSGKSGAARAPAKPSPVLQASQPRSNLRTVKRSSSGPRRSWSATRTLSLEDLTPTPSQAEPDSASQVEANAHALDADTTSTLPANNHTTPSSLPNNPSSEGKQGPTLFQGTPHHNAAGRDSGVTAMDRNPQPRKGIAPSPQPELRATRARVAARPRLSRPSGRRPSFYQSPEKGRREDCERIAVRAQESALAEATVVQPLKSLALSLAEATPGRNRLPHAAYATSGRNLGQTASNTEAPRSENTGDSSEAPSRATNSCADSPHKGLQDEELAREALNGRGNLSMPSVPAYENTVHEPQDLEKSAFTAFAPPKLTEHRSWSSGEHEVGAAAAVTLSIPMPVSLHRSNDLRLHRAEIIKGTQPLPTWSAKKWLEQCQEAMVRIARSD